MKLKLTIFLMAMSTMVVYGQITKEVDNGVFVTFPNTPKYTTSIQASTYVTKSNNCFFMAIVLRNKIPDYAQYVQAKKKWTKAEVKKVEDAFLDNTVKGLLDYTGSNGSISEIKIGSFSGRKIEYSAINPVTGERGKRFSILLLIRDKIIIFTCWYLKENTIAETEKDNFLNSIKAK